MMERLGGASMTRQQARERAADALCTVGLDGLGHQWFNSLSGRQRQRTLIARGLATARKILLLDELTSAEDSIVRLLERLRGSMKSLNITHIAAVASRFPDSIYCANRCFHAHPPTDRLDEDLMRHITGFTSPGSLAGGTADP